MRLVLITIGDQTQRTGGYLYHHRITRWAPTFGASVKSVSFPDLPFPLPFLGAAKVLWETLRARPHAVLLDSLAAAYLAPFIGLIKKMVPVIPIVHQPPGGVDHRSLSARVLRWLDTQVYQSVPAIIACSPLLADDLKRSGLGQRIEVAEPGKDLPETSFQPAPNLRQGRRIALLCVANWSPVKDILSLLEAFSTLDDSIATLHLVGEENLQTEYGREVMARVQRPDLKDRTLVHGSVSPTDLPRFYESSDLFVLTSLGESYGMVYAEAMSSGLPIVGWRRGNLPFLVEHHREGWLVERGDLREFAKAIQTLALDPDLRLKLSQAATERSAHLPFWEDTTQRILEIVQDVIHR